MSLAAQLQWEYDTRFAAKQDFLWALKFDPKQPRDDHGRWKSGWGELLSAISKPDGGFTYDPFTKTSPKSGFMVSIYKPHEQILDVGEVNGVTLARYVRKNRNLLRYKRNYLGVWHNPENGKVYLDVSRHTRSAKEARRLGKKHDQEAYFNLNTGKSVDLNPNGKETLAKIDQGSDRGGSRPVDEGTHRERPDTEGNRGDEKDPLRRYAGVLKYDPAQARNPKGVSTGGQFAAEGRDANGLNPNTGQRIETGGGWRQSETGEGVYHGMSTWMNPNYEPPAVQHTPIGGKNYWMWGGSHSGSSAITGASAKQMGIAGYEDKGASDEAVDVATRMVKAIAEDTVGSEEILHHVFENVRHTEFKVGDTMQLPLTATSGDVGLPYGIRSDADRQRGQPVVFEFEKGTQMVGYGITRERDEEDIGQTVHEQFKEQGYIWNEAIVAGAFEVVSVREAYMGSQHFNEFYRKPENEGKTIQIYGKVVRLRQIKTFDPKTKTWVPRG